MGAFTIYNFGTGSSENDKDDLIAMLYNETDGARAKNKLITSGPGSTLIVEPRYDPALDPKEYQGSTDIIYMGVGKLSGSADATDQVKFNVDHVLQVLKGLKIRPSIVNMAGWSRGACTCHAIAHAMKNSGVPWLRNVPVNIFAVDPVPGTGHEKKHDWITVPDNVWNYVAVFMENEHRWWCDAAYLQIENEQKTNTVLLNMPGKHYYMVLAKYQETPKFGEVPKVGGHLIQETLQSWGTQFTKPTLKLSDPAVLDCYAGMIKKTDAFFENGGEKIYRLTGNHVSKLRIQNHLLSKAPYFVNSHHTEVFKRVLPKIYTYYFEHGSFDETKPFAVYQHNAYEKFGQSKEVLMDMMREDERAKGLVPNTYETLHAFGDFVGKRRAKVLQMKDQYVTGGLVKPVPSFLGLKKVS